MVGEDTAAPQGKFGLGRAALPEEIAAWDVDIMPDGRGLPEGSGDVWTGEEVFADNCAVCHGDFAEGVDNWPKLAGGMDTLDHEDPLKTVGSYWPYLSTTFDYVRRSMPFGAAQTMSDDDVYAITAYILYSNDLVDEDFTLSKETFFDVEMPNAGGFIVDDRAETEYPLFSQDPCMENCKESVEITMRAAVLDVTPDEDGEDTGEEAAVAPAADDGTQVASADPVTLAPAAAAPADTAAATEAAPEATEGAAPASEVDPALVASGEKVFKKCKACHQVGDGAKNKVGPVLNGIVGRAAGTGDRFKYSKAMVEAGAGGMVWDEANLAGYLAAPKTFLKGNKMAFAGLKKDDDIAAITAFLKSHP
ncbi:c-type cytochrome [Aliiruegeria haliotis]|nr:c-type cytochrome [Aliiruegeria haliotis]